MINIDAGIESGISIWDIYPIGHPFVMSPSIISEYMRVYILCQIRLRSFRNRCRDHDGLVILIIVRYPNYGFELGWICTTVIFNKKITIIDRGLNGSTLNRSDAQNENVQQSNKDGQGDGDKANGSMGSLHALKPRCLPVLQFH